MSVRTSDPATSRDAARLTDREGGRIRVEEYFRRIYPNGATDHEAAHALGMLQTSSGKRRKDAGNHIEATDERRLTPVGATATVWRWVPALFRRPVRCSHCRVEWHDSDALDSKGRCRDRAECEAHCAVQDRDAMLEARAS